jgi:transglutaminase-like putative cysteine protease
MSSNNQHRHIELQGAERAGPDRFRLSLPPEGLFSIVAVLAMLVIVGVAVDEAGWVGSVPGTRISQTGFLPLTMVIAGLVGLVLARAPIGAVRAHALGATLGALVLLLFASGAFVNVDSLQLRMEWLNWSVHQWAWESIGLGIRSSQTSVFVLLLGALMWGIGQLGAFNVFRRRRAVPLIVLGAVVLLLNVSLTTRDQFMHLVLFSGGAMLLLVRLNLLAELDGWRSRRLVDIGDAGALFLNRGAAFIAVALVSSIALAGTASSAPLANSWRGVDGNLLELGYAVNRWLGGVSGPVRGQANLTGPTQTLRDVWESSNEPVFTARVGDSGAYYWRGATYDSFDGRTWLQLDAVGATIPAGESILSATGEQLFGLKARRQLAVSVTAAAGDWSIFLPESPLVVDRVAERASHLGQGGFLYLRLPEGFREGTSYGAISLVPQETGAGRITAGGLAAASTDYEPWLSRYLEIRPGSIGERTYEEADRIVAGLADDKRNPYHIAEAIQNWFWRDGGFEYTTNVAGSCVGQNMTDCFLEDRRGFCERFATAMTMMLRTQGIPARYVVGYLPGKSLGDNTWQIERSAAHAWVEVYFPEYGWYRFDPTPGNTINGQAPTAIEEGPRGSTPPPSFAPALPPDYRDDEDDLVIPRVDNPIVPPADRPAGSGGRPLDMPLILLVLGVATGVGLYYFGRRRQRRPLEVARAYDGLTRLATRLGYGPRPTQTIYEYTGGLAQLVPAVAADLDLLAAAKVEATYGRRQPSKSITFRLGLAYRRIRLNLLRLILRRARLPGRPTQIRRRQG